MTDRVAMFAGRSLHAGTAQSPLLRLDEPLSFWGGLDPTSGTIIDRSHAQHAVCLQGFIVAMPGSRGSSGTPGVLGEALRLGTGPAAMILTKADINLVAGAMVAEALYGVSCPIVLLDGESLSQLVDGVGTEIASDGSVIQGL